MTAEDGPYVKALEEDLYKQRERLEAAREALAEVRKTLGCGLEDDEVAVAKRLVEERNEACQRAAGLESMVQQHQQETIYWWGRARRAEARVEEMDPPKRQPLYAVPVGQGWGILEDGHLRAKGFTTQHDAELAMRLLVEKR